MSEYMTLDQSPSNAAREMCPCDRITFDKCQQKQMHIWPQINTYKKKQKTVKLCSHYSFANESSNVVNEN